MLYENNNPIHLSLILEKTGLVYWVNRSMGLTTCTIWVDSVWYYILNQLLRHELYYQNSWVTEQSVIDNYHNELTLKELPRLTIFNIYYSYFTKNRTIVLSNITNDGIRSLDNTFKNCNWLEREASEMYGIHFLFKTDSRKLLLDYSKIEHPMLKNFPSEGIKDVFYDIMENQVSIVNNETTEL